MAQPRTVGRAEVVSACPCVPVLAASLVGPLVCSFVLLFGAPLLFVVVGSCYVAFVFLRLCLACFSLSPLSAYALLVLEGLGLGEYAGRSLAESIK